MTWKCLYANDMVPHMKRPVGSFWWRDVMSPKNSFFSIASCKVNVWNTVCFWTDLWDIGVPKLLFPQLFSFATNGKFSVRKFIAQDLYTNFFTPLSLEASGAVLPELVDVNIQGLRRTHGSCPRRKTYSTRLAGSRRSMTAHASRKIIHRSVSRPGVSIQTASRLAVTW